jgi:hypothetical protein
MDVEDKVPLKRKLKSLQYLLIPAGTTPRNKRIANFLFNWLLMADAICLDDGGYLG